MPSLVSPLYSRFGVLKPAPLDNENGLVGWWTLDDATGIDSSGSGRNATSSVGTITWASQSIIGGAATFTAGRFVLPTSLFYSNVLTMSVWVRPSTVSGSGFICGVTTSNTDQMRLLRNTTTYNGGNTSNLASISGAAAAGIWAHLVLTSDGTTTQLYLNGVAAGTTGTTNFSTLGAPAYIASNNGTNDFAGTLDDVRWYNRALSASEIFALYSQGMAFANLYSEGEMPILRPVQGGMSDSELFIRRRTHTRLMGWFK